MARWILERGGVVRGYLLTAGEPSEAEQRRVAFGAADAEGDLAEAGTWRLVPAEAGAVGDGWTFNGASYSQPMPAVADYARAVDAHVDATAKARGYNSAESCASYVASTHAAWRDEAAAFIAWRDAVWVSVFTQMAAVQQGGAPPTMAALLAALPPMEWPITAP